MPGKSSPRASNNSSAQLGFEAKLWLAADKLRSNMDAGEYKHVVLGLIFLKYISDTFEELVEAGARVVFRQDAFEAASTDQVASHGYVLTPGRYVGTEELEDDGDPFEEKMPRLVAELHAQFAESAKLEQRTEVCEFGHWVAVAHKIHYV